VEVGGCSRLAMWWTVPFTPRRTDATEAQTDVASFAVLEPQADGFRNCSMGC
jgi:catalase (peroxidase I)